jgi:hypothetical protein
MLAINGLRLEGDLADHHLISVTGLRRLFVRTDIYGFALLLGTCLSASGRRRVRPDKVKETADHSSLVFAFPARETKLRKDDKAFTFELLLNGMALKAKFDPKEMLFRGELAV